MRSRKPPTSSSAASTSWSTTPACRRSRRRCTETSEELFDKVIAINFKGPFRLAALVGERMVAGSGGVIINLSSTASYLPMPHTIPYGGAKAAINSMTVALAKAFGPKVRVNCICPGPFLTDVSTAWRDEQDGAARRLGLRRFGNPEEIVGTALYLASDASCVHDGPGHSGGWRQLVALSVMTGEGAPESAVPLVRKRNLGIARLRSSPLPRV